jgi:hypothetical protein
MITPEMYQLLANREEGQEYFLAEVDRALAPLMGLLGDVVFIPEHFKDKRPRLCGWNRLTQDSLTDDYFRALEASIIEGGNIGVLLSKPSGNLCTVDLDFQLAVEPFLLDNPRLRKTLASTGSGVGAQFWIRVSGYYLPKVLKLSVTEALAKKYQVPQNPYTQTYDVGEWRGGQKSTIWGVHPSGKEYRILTPNPPIEISMDEIVPPRGWRLREIRPTEFGPVAPTEEELINSTRENREAKKQWRGGGGSH